MCDNEVFADSCVFLSYAYIFEEFSIYSERLFVGKKYNIYTSETVKDEIATRRSRRNLAYPSFVASLSKRETLNEIAGRLGMYLAPSDLSHFKSLSDYLLAHASLIDILAEFRRWKSISEKRFDEAEKRLAGVVGRCDDPYMKDLIRTIISNDSDSKIVIEVFEWSKNISYPKFVTIDSTDIYKNSANILGKLMDFKSLDDEPFRILHVIELDCS